MCQSAFFFFFFFFQIRKQSYKNAITVKIVLKKSHLKLSSWWTVKPTNSQNLAILSPTVRLREVI